MINKNKRSEALDILGEVPVAKNEGLSDEERVIGNLSDSIAKMAVKTGLYCDTVFSEVHLVAACVDTADELLRLRNEVDSLQAQIDSKEFSTDEFMKGVIALADKRDAYCKVQPACPKCETMQVQLVSWDTGAKWKCRHCKTKWETL
jgi:hypothetical protein